MLDISADLMFVNMLAFFLTSSQNVRFLMSESIIRRTKSQLLNSQKMVFSFYKSNGCSINTCFTDGEFDCLKHEVEGISVDTSAKNEHVNDI